MKKLLLALGIFSSLAVGISLQGRGVDNTNCNTFGECLSENLPDSGGGGSDGGSGGGGGSLPPIYEWTPVITDATLQFFCDTNRTSYNGKTLFDYIKYDSSKVSNNGGILCMNVFLPYGAFEFYPWSQKYSNFVFLSTTRVVDFAGNTTFLYSSTTHDVFENDGNFKYFLVNWNDRYLYIYDYSNNTLTKQTSNSFLYKYATQGYIYCSNGQKAKAVFHSWGSGYSYIANKCGGIWKNTRIRWINNPSNIELNPFVINSSLTYTGIYSVNNIVLKAFSLDYLKNCISRNRCDWNSGKTILDLSSLEDLIKTKYGETPLLRAIYPDINDSAFYVTESPEGQIARRFDYYYAYFELNRNLDISNGYIVKVESIGYRYKTSQENLCILESQDSSGSVSRIELSKELTNNTCPNEILFYGWMKILSGNKGTLLVLTTLKIDGNYKNVIGILYPDTSKVDGYYLGKFPIFTQIIFKPLIIGDSLIYRGLLRVRGKDYYFFYTYVPSGASKVYLIHSPQFNRSDAGAERY